MPPRGGDLPGFATLPSDYCEVVSAAQGSVLVFPISVFNGHRFARHVWRFHIVFDSRYVANHFDEGEEVVTGWGCRLKPRLESDNLPPSRDCE